MTFRRLADRPWRDRATTDTIAWLPPEADTPSRWLTATEWHARIGAWQQRLLETPNTSGCWRLFEPDPIEFSAAMIAIWERGDRVVLPADNQPMTLSALDEAGVALGPTERGPRATGREAPLTTHPSGTHARYPISPSRSTRPAPAASHSGWTNVSTSWMPNSPPKPRSGRCRADWSSARSVTSTFTACCSRSCARYARTAPSRPGPVVIRKPSTPGCSTARRPASG